MMKKIKKIFTLLFVFLFTFSLASCNKGEQKGDSIKDQFDCITVTEAMEKAIEAGEAGTTDSFYVYGKVKKITNSLYGEMFITDDTNEIYVYGVRGEGDVYFDKLTDAPEVGDEVVLYGSLKVFNDQPEMSKSTLKALKHAEKAPVDDSEYTEATVKESRTMSKGSKVKLNGIVGFVTKANSLNPNGFYLIDETGSTYVYDPALAGQVKVGNKVTIVGETNLYVSSKEASSAEKHGYNGSIQISDAKLLENDKGTNDFNKTWIKESTVKELVEDKNYTQNTGNIVKVNAFIKKVPGEGFTNYYINDLDGKTGSYVYTSNNGKDFEYLDEFDGKVCTIYLSVINYKSQPTKMTPRFIPVLVKNDNFVFNKADAPKFVLDYVVMDTIDSIYNVDPKQEMLTTYSNASLGLDNVAITYDSTNKDIFSFETENDKLILHGHKDGKSTIKVTVTCESHTLTQEKEVEFKTPNLSNILTVKEAIAKPEKTEVKVKGVVASSLVNKDGFYLNDETGMIAIRTSEEALADIEIGNEIIIAGTKKLGGKYNYKGEPVEGIYGQNYIELTSIEVNNKGNHAYSTTSFIKDKKIEDLSAFDINEDHTAEVYELKCKVTITEGKYKNYQLKSVTPGQEDAYIELYSSSYKQYNMLEKYVDKEVTIHIALCNWNGKKFYKGCLIAVVDGDNRDVNSLNFAK